MFYTDIHFNPSQQKAVKVLNIDDKSKDKTIAQSLHSGYEWDGKVLRKEMVEVYVYKADSNSEEVN